jgi:uncharacterized membrane protein YfcA
LAFPVVTDWHFYAVAIPAVLLLGVSKSGFGAGFGSLAVPMMALTVTVPQAAAMLMPALLLMDLLGIAAFRRDFDARLLKFLIPCSLVGTVVVTLLFLAQRLLFPPRPDATPPSNAVGGVLAAIGGFTSFVAHAGGPPVSAYMIPLKLRPVVFTATMAYLFFVINLSKWIPYAWLGLLDLRNMATSLVLLPFAPIGVWVGIRIARRIDPVWFYRFVYAGMALTGIKLVSDALPIR